MQKGFPLINYLKCAKQLNASRFRWLLLLNFPLVSFILQFFSIPTVSKKTPKQTAQASAQTYLKFEGFFKFLQITY